MDVEKRSIGDMIKNLIVIIWLVGSVVAYTLFCLIAFILNRRFCRSLAVFWSRQLLWIAGVRISTKGMEQLDPGKRYVFISNHQSHIDIPVLYKSIPCQLSFIAKKELFRIPFFGWCLYMLGHIWIDRTNARKAHASIDQAVSRLQNDNTSLVLFPEGTRSADGSMNQLKQGSFSLVFKAGVEVVPVVIHDSNRILKKHSRKLKGGTVHVTVCTPFTVAPTQTKAEIARMMQEKMAQVLEEGFSPEN